jgi:hypothetical protein
MKALPVSFVVFVLVSGPCLAGQPVTSSPASASQAESVVCLLLPYLPGSYRAPRFAAAHGARRVESEGHRTAYGCREVCERAPRNSRTQLGAKNHLTRSAEELIRCLK